MLARVALGVRTLTHWIADLGREDNLAAPNEFPHQSADHFLALAERVKITGVDQIDAKIECPLNDLPARVFIENPLAPGGMTDPHSAEAETGYGEVGGP